MTTSLTTYRRRALAGATAVVLVALAGCGESDDSIPATDTDGIVTYACSLVGEFEHGEPVDAWDWDSIPGPDSGEGFVNGTAIHALVGAGSTAPLVGHENLSEAADALFRGISEGEADDVENAIGDLVSACEEGGFADDEVDVTANGRIAYACALVDDNLATDQPVDEWIGSAAHADVEDRLVLTQAVGAAGLLGAPIAYEAPDHSEISAEAQRLYAGITRADTEMIGESLDELSGLCSDV
ncbi:hypothetical protein ACPYO6_13380 [Georgenia sp. Z1344]|uniref:hypothetical protein n=1 Tax=Georgenia sp. Z1344 TaxID=3416706 RepID=UPI003CEB412A